MNYKHLLLLSMLGLAACDGSDSPSQSNRSGTFGELPAAVHKTQEQLGSAQTTLLGVADQDQGKQVKLGAAEAIAAAGRLVKTGQDAAAVSTLKSAGLLSAASTDDEVRQAATVMADAGLSEEAYLLYAPDDFVLNDPTAYNYKPEGSLPAAIDEKPSVKRHTMELDGKKVWYTASAGHLTAFAKNPEKEGPEASIFYTAYTRDDLPRENRLVTFFFNGGPGASSIYLHLGAFAPKRAFVDGPNTKPEWTKAPPQNFPMIDNKESLLGKSDLVFVDPVGTGFSQAIAPRSNKGFWGVKVDVEVARDFIIRYINANKRQASPKYLYGESYGGGIRVPKLARALEEAGTRSYEKIEAGPAPKVLTGVVFHSPAFDYGASDEEGMFPTTAMTMDYFKLSTARGDASADQYAATLRKFAVDNYDPESETLFKSEVDLTPYVGDGSYSTAPKFVLWSLMPDSEFNAYDLRTRIKYDTDKNGKIIGIPYNFDFYDDVGLQADITTYLPEFVNYNSSARYINASCGADWNSQEHLAFERWEDRFDMGTGLPDIVDTIGYDPTIKLLTVHGYYDAVTPFFRSELSLKGVVLDEKTKTTLLDRVPIKLFEGGHMIYYSEEARVPLIKALEKFYDDPPYGGAKPVTTPAAVASAGTPARTTESAIAGR
jgi:carboxypeptidase C (cathepsin A)